MFFSKSHFLYDFQGSQEGAFGVPHRHVSYQHRFSVFLHPYIEKVLLSGAEGVNQVFTMGTTFGGWQV